MIKAILNFIHKKKKLLVSIVVLGGVLLFIFRERWLQLIGDYLVLQENFRSADVIHVIAGEDYRTDFAIQLLKQGVGKTLFFTGGWCDDHLYNHGEHGKARAIGQGVPEDAVAFDDSPVISTYQEVERLKEWIDSRQIPVSSVIVVSDPFHMRRARWTYRRILGEGIEVYTAPVPFDRTPYQRRWWRDQGSRQNVRTEYGKYVYYILRYQISRGKLQDWLASLDKE